MSSRDSLPLFPGSSISKKMPPKDPNNILLHTVPNSWAKQAHIQRWYFEWDTYKARCDMFKGMEISEQIYEGGTTYNKPMREYANCASCGRKRGGR